MGVAGCGKSTVGGALAQALSVPLIEGDDFHSDASKAKMRNGIALTDADREGWLDSLGAQLAARPQGAVLTCSALKRRYRDRLRHAVPHMRFVHLAIEQPLALQRVAARAAKHLLASQFATLEPPLDEPDVLVVDGSLPLSRIRQLALQWLGAEGARDGC